MRDWKRRRRPSRSQVARALVAAAPLDRGAQVAAVAAAPEKDLQAAVLAQARLLGWRCYHTHDSRRSAAGFPDLVLVRGARLVFAELKANRGRTTQAQDDWLAALRKTGAEVHVWRPADWHSGAVGAVLAGRR